MRNLPEERLKRRQSERRKEIKQRITLWSIIAVSVSYALVELVKPII